MSAEIDALIGTVVHAHFWLNNCRMMIDGPLSVSEDGFEYQIRVTDSENAEVVAMAFFPKDRTVLDAHGINGPTLRPKT